MCFLGEMRKMSILITELQCQESHEAHFFIIMPHAQSPSVFFFFFFFFLFVAVLMLLQSKPLSHNLM